MVSEIIGRHGRRWSAIRAVVLTASDICGLCSHYGADSIDHVIPRALCLMAGRPDLVEDLVNLRPAHHQPCATCGRRCNRERAEADRQARDAYMVEALHLRGLPGEPADAIVQRYVRKMLQQEPDLRSSREW